MTDLAEFLLARITEDEAIADRAEELPGSHRGHPAATAPLWTVSEPPRGDVCATPGRIRAEDDAKRRIVELHRPRNSSRDRYFCCRECDVQYGDSDSTTPNVWCRTLKRLALPYADHPDYDEAWRR